MFHFNCNNVRKYVVMVELRLQEMVLECCRLLAKEGRSWGRERVTTTNEHE
jgi:hypothetical protein